MPIEVAKFNTRKGGLNCVPLKNLLKLKSDYVNERKERMTEFKINLRMI